MTANPALDETDHNYSAAQSDRFLEIAQECIIPALRDAATWALVEQDRDFTFDQRTSIEAAILIGAVCRFLKHAADNVPGGCACEGCSAKRFDHNAKRFLVSLTHTMMPQIFEQEDESE